MLGSNHPQTLASKNNLAICLQEKGNLDEALVHFKALEKSTTEVLGSNHPQTLTYKNNLATCLRAKGNLDEALVLFKALEKSTTESIGFKSSSNINIQK